MKKRIKRYLLRKLNNFKELVPAKVYREETLIITFLENDKTIKVCTIKDENIIFIPNKISNTKVFSRFFAIRDFFKFLFNEKNSESY